MSRQLLKLNATQADVIKAIQIRMKSMDHEIGGSFGAGALDRLFRDVQVLNALLDKPVRVGTAEATD